MSDGLWMMDLNGFPGRFVRVTVMSVDGSAPRDAGTAMTVSAESTRGTFGGGRLEFEAIEEARRILADAGNAPWQRRVLTYPLGPALGQCCGGMVRLLYEVYNADTSATLLEAISKHGPRELDRSTRGVLVRSCRSGIAAELLIGRRAAADVPPAVLALVRDMERGSVTRKTHVIESAGGETFVVEPVSKHRPAVSIYGAGHVGHAIVDALMLLDLDVTWYDVDERRFPKDAAPEARRIACDDLPELLRTASDIGRYHVVVTFSHALDEALAKVLLVREEPIFVGVIGSKTKAARFRQRLAADGVSESDLAKFVCPIGIDGLRGKEPAIIAASVAADLLLRFQSTESGHARKGQVRSRPGT